MCPFFDQRFSDTSEVFQDLSQLVRGKIKDASSVSGLVVTQPGDLSDIHNRLDQSKFLFHYDFLYQVYVLRDPPTLDVIASLTLTQAGAVLRRVCSA